MVTTQHEINSGKVDSVVALVGRVKFSFIRCSSQTHATLLKSYLECTYHPSYESFNANPVEQRFNRVFRIFEFSRRNGMRGPIPSSLCRPVGRASLSLFPVLLLLLPQSESAITGERSRAGEVRNIFSAFSPSGAIKRPETPMQQPPAEIRDRLLTGLDQDYNVSPRLPREIPVECRQGRSRRPPRGRRGRETLSGTRGSLSNPPGPRECSRAPLRPPGGRATPVSSGLFSVL